ncbi:LapA family protein [Gracilinema caldarium]|uniref:Lipopolysaccharide assembly protein A domain-containing protein n=1 Tax=Gracilinema caldarium (strain ATCC 51460 / DSM 7334 / H1) TaxID=744872 RepID=F8EYN0_GRAC1|nr:LapA family protein [Gracilinema caldarium]AEJ18607.1 hypothetical protein Spica_0443 [Gracilinema caldarium DSM 7334]
MKIINTLISVSLLLLITIFASQNTITVTINFFNTSVSGSLALMLLIAFILGFFSGIVFLLPSYIRTSLKRQKKMQDVNNIPQNNSNNFTTGASKD